MAITMTRAKANAVKQQTGKKHEKTEFSPVTDSNYKMLKLEADTIYDIYVPNLTEKVELLDEEGTPVKDDNGEVIMVDDMAVDKFAVHNVYGLNKDGTKRIFKGNYRCTHGIKMEDEGLDGSCPLCDAFFQIETKWVRTKAEAEAKARGVDPNNVEEMKAIKKKLWKQSFVSNTSERVTLPVFELVKEKKIVNGKEKSVPVKAVDDAGNPIYVDGDTNQPMYQFNVYWYTMAKSRYEKFFCDSVAMLSENEDTIPAGYIFSIKAGKGKPMEVAKEATCVAKGIPGQMKNMSKIAYMYEYFDKIAEEKYTVADAMNVIKENQLHTVEELTKLVVANEAPKQKEIDLLEAQEGLDTTDTVADNEIEDMLADVEAE